MMRQIFIGASAVVVVILVVTHDYVWSREDPFNLA